MLYNLTTGRDMDSTEAVTIGATKNVTWANDRPLMMANGWREMGDVPALDPAYTRHSLTWQQDPGDPEKVEAVVVDQLTSEWEAEKAAAAAAAAAAALKQEKLDRWAARAPNNVWEHWSERRW